MVTDDGPSSQGIVIVSLDVLSLFCWIENGTLRENFLLPPLYENTATLIQAKARTKTSAPIILLVPSHVKREWKYVRTGGLVNRERSGEECSTRRVLTDLFSYSPISFSALYTKWILFRRLSKREAGNWRKKQTKKEYTLKNHYVHSRLKQELAWSGSHSNMALT